MECKFKQISHLKGGQSLPVHTTQTVVNEAINCLIGNVGDHMYNKAVIEKSKTFLKNKIIGVQVDSVKQVYQARPTTPYLCKEQQSPRKGVADCMRPMSAQIRSSTKSNPRTTLNNDSRKTIQSYAGSIAGYHRYNRNTSIARSVTDSKKNSKRVYSAKPPQNQKKFFAVNSTCEQDDDLNMEFIEQLRMKKKQEQNQIKKKQQFLKSIQMDSTIYSTAQSKFIQTISRKKFIYGNQGEVIEINGTAQKLHLKKISAMSKSRVEVKSKKNEDLKKFQEDLKQNIYIEFKGRQLFQSRPETGQPTKKRHNLEQGLQSRNIKSAAIMRETKNKTQPLKTIKKIQQGNNSTNPQNNPNPNNNTTNPNNSKSSNNNLPINKHGHHQKTPPFNNRDTRGSTETDKGNGNNNNTPQIKKMQKVLFYQSANSVYRVVCEGTPQVSPGVTVENF